jgi:hypothetical protein
MKGEPKSSNKMMRQKTCKDQSMERTKVHSEFEVSLFGTAMRESEDLHRRKDGVEGRTTSDITASSLKLRRANAQLSVHSLTHEWSQF